jgi:hypothetical protein
VLQNKLLGNTNFIIFRLTNQKLWGNENFRRSLGKVGKCWSQPIRVDHIIPKRWIGGRRRFDKTLSSFLNFAPHTCEDEIFYSLWSLEISF